MGMYDFKLDLPESVPDEYKAIIRAEILRVIYTQELQKRFKVHDCGPSIGLDCDARARIDASDDLLRQDVRNRLIECRRAIDIILERLA